MNRTNQVLLVDSAAIVALFDLQCPGAAERLAREHAGWRGSATVKQLDAESAALIIRPGGALGARR